MTGLEPERHRIIEIAAILTDFHLNIVAKGPELVVFQPEPVLDAVSEFWTKSEAYGSDPSLLDRVRESKVTTQDAETAMLDFVKKHCGRSTCHLAGNSIHQDLLFLRLEMPRLVDYLHYRILDVSSFKLCCMHWHTAVYKQRPTKKSTHRAMNDVMESIEEMQYYKAKFTRSA